MWLTLLYVAGGLLLLGLIAYFIFKRNYFNKHKYVRLERFNRDKSISIRYIKRDQFNNDKSLLINPAHVYNYKGYTSIMTTSECAESINPLDFQSKYDGVKFKTAIRSKLIVDTFDSIKKPKLDFLMISVVLNVVIIMILLYTTFVV